MKYSKILLIASTIFALSSTETVAVSWNPAKLNKVHKSVRNKLSDVHRKIRAAALGNTRSGSTKTPSCPCVAGGTNDRKLLRAEGTDPLHPSPFTEYYVWQCRGGKWNNTYTQIPIPFGSGAKCPSS